MTNSHYTTNEETFEPYIDEISSKVFQYDFFNNKIFFIIMESSKNKGVESAMIKTFLDTISDGTKTIEEAERILYIGYYKAGIHSGPYFADKTDDQIMAIHNRNPAICYFHSHLEKMKPKLKTILLAHQRDSRIDDILS